LSSSRTVVAGRGGQRALQVRVDLQTAFTVRAERVDLGSGERVGVVDQDEPRYLGVQVAEREVQVRRGGRLRGRLAPMTRT
jgi:hypothetical protein